jgi:hypothetical protein
MGLPRSEPHVAFDQPTRIRRRSERSSAGQGLQAAMSGFPTPSRSPDDLHHGVLGEAEITTDQAIGQTVTVQASASLPCWRPAAATAAIRQSLGSVGRGRSGTTTDRGDGPHWVPFSFAENAAILLLIKQCHGRDSVGGQSVRAQISI